MIYLLLALGGVMLARQVYKFTSVATMPTAGSYLHLVKNLTQSNAKMQDSNVKTQFMQFVVDLGIRSLNNQTGIGYFRLPQLGQVYVLSNPSVIKQFYEKKNNPNFSQLRFFNRLALILGPDNLMSSPLNSPTHTLVRKSIFNRNGGQGALQITPKGVIAKGDKEQGQKQANSLLFFSKEFALNETKDGFTNGDSVTKEQRFG